MKIRFQFQTREEGNQGVGMQGLLAGFIYLIVFIALFVNAAAAKENSVAPGVQAATPGDKGELLRVVVLSRHGVRAPIGPPETRVRWTVSTWPDFKVPPGYLTPRGGELVRLMGAYYRDYLAEQGLFFRAGCPARERVQVHADVDQRTQATAERIVEGFAPGCGLPVRKADGERDPLFHPVEVNLCKFNLEQARSAVMRRAGEDFAALARAERDALQTLQGVLQCCTPRMCDKSFGGPGGPCTLPALPTRLKVDPAKISLEGGLAIASTYAEILLLEYGNGFSGKEFGFGRADVAKMQQGFRVHVLASDIVQRAPYIAQRQGSMLLGKITDALLAEAGDPRLLLLVGHDTNIDNVAALLGASWHLQGYRANQTPPGGALAFELRRGRDGQLRVYGTYLSQSLSQLRDARPLSVRSPPLKQALRIPACSSDRKGHPCLLADFVKAARLAVDPACMR